MNTHVSLSISIHTHVNRLRVHFYSGSVFVILPFYAGCPGPWQRLHDAHGALLYSQGVWADSVGASFYSDGVPALF